MEIIIPFLILLTALLPALLWLIFFLREDIHPEPKRLIIYTLSVGALISIPVLATQIIFQEFSSNFIRNTVFLIIGLAFIEEVFKFLGAYWAINKDSAFDEPIDAMIYMIVVALGFTTVENLFIVASNLTPIGGGSLSTTFSTLSLRFIGATLLHTLSSGFVGYFWALGKIKRKTPVYLILGITLATIIHFIFNYLILKFQETNLLYPSIFLVISAFFILHDFDKLKNEKEKLA